MLAGVLVSMSVMCVLSAVSIRWQVRRILQVLLGRLAIH